MSEFEPTERVVPILGIDDSGNVRDFLGTGFFVHPGPVLITAEHVVRPWTDKFAITFMSDLKHLVPARVIRADRSRDLAVLEVPSRSIENAFDLAADDELKLNQLCVTLEYGQTRSEGRELRLSPACRVGNITRYLNLDGKYGRGVGGQSALELSFPALRGASGSPVVSNQTFRVWGVVVANIAYQLEPAQVVSVLDQKNNLLEQVQYFLPQSIAVHVGHLRSLLKECGLSCS